jgi:hypothetical protein
MRNSSAIIALALAAGTVCQAAAQTAAPVQPAPQTTEIKVGQLLYTAAGGAIAPVNRITAAGNLQLIVEQHLVTIPAATVSMTNGKPTTTLSLAELRRMARQ